MNSQDPGNVPGNSENGGTGSPDHILLPEPGNTQPDLQGPVLEESQSPPPAQSGGGLDLDSPLRWADLVYLLVFYIMAGYLLALAVAASEAVRTHTSIGVVLRNLDGSEASLAVLIQALLSFATLAFLYVLVRGRSGAPFWPAVGWRRFRVMVSWGVSAARYALFGCGLAAAVSVVSNFLDNGKTLPMEELFRNRQTVVLLILLGVLVAPLLEETIFRGCLYPVVARQFGVAASVVVTGMLFGLAHAPQLWGGWGQIALLMGVGMVLTYIRARAGTVFASYFVHVAYNSTLFVALIFSTGGLRHFPTT
jgi:membrane protease YdiL (CAAX protease family)